MAINLKRTSTITADGVKILVYGQAGAGKTFLIKTLPNPVILSAEGGLLSIAGTDIPYIEINGIKDLHEAYQWLTAPTRRRAFRAWRWIPSPRLRRWC